MKEDSDIDRTFPFRIPNHVIQVYFNFSVKLEGAVQSLLYNSLAISSSHWSWDHTPDFSNAVPLTESVQWARITLRADIQFVMPVAILPNLSELALCFILCCPWSVALFFYFVSFMCCWLLYISSLHSFGLCCWHFCPFHDKPRKMEANQLNWPHLLYGSPTGLIS